MRSPDDMQPAALTTSFIFEPTTRISTDFFFAALVAFAMCVSSLVQPRTAKRRAQLQRSILRLVGSHASVILAPIGDRRLFCESNRRRGEAPPSGLCPRGCPFHGQLFQVKYAITIPTAVSDHAAHNP